MRIESGHVIVVSAIFAAIVGTFFASNTITGLNVARQEGDFAAVTESGEQTIIVDKFQQAVGSVIIASMSIAALVVVARIGKNTMTFQQGIATDIKNAEKSLQEGNHSDAFKLYDSIRGQYATLDEKGKNRHHQRIMNLYAQLAKQATIAEAHYLTDRYVSGAITQAEFERLKLIIESQ